MRCATARRSPTMPEPLHRLRRGLLREPAGGDRVMAQVLAIVLTAGLDAVLVAVELALETGPPSGKVSVEHVVNVLGRLNAVQRRLPTSAQTHAEGQSTPPLADTARYDRLACTGWYSTCERRTSSHNEGAGHEA